MMGERVSLRDSVLILIVMAAVVAFRLLTFGPPELNGFDEGVYTHYGEVLGQHGVAGLKAVAARWADDEVLRQGPLPFRVAFIGAGAICCRLVGEFSPFGFALVSFAGGVLLALAGMLLAKRWLNSRAGVVLVGLVCGASPLATGLSRRALQDSGFAALVVLALWSLDRFIEKRQIRDATVLGVVLFLGFLTKESMLFVYPLLLVAYLVRGGHREHDGLGVLLAALALAPVLALGVMVYLAGSLPALLATYSTYSELQHTIPYAKMWQSGPWFRYIVDFLLVSPVVMLLAAVGITSSDPFVERGRSLAVSILLLGLAVFSCLPLLNLRIVLFLDTPLRILAVAGILVVGQKLGGDSRKGLWTAAVIGGAVVLLDLVQFRTLFVAGGIYDPVTFNLMQALGFAP